MLVLSGLGLPIGMPHRVFLREDLNQTSIADLLVLVNTILRVVLICVLLAFVFVPDLGWSAGLWSALFHTVSGVIIMALMFIGRVGPLTLGFFLGTRVSTRIRYPSTRVLLG